MDASSGLLFFYAALLLHLCLTITAGDPYYISYSCPPVANYTANSTYHENLSTLLSSMSSNATVHNGFYNGTAGQESDTVYGIYLCRGGVSSDMCRDCVNASTHRIMEQCPNQKEAIIWYLECMLRYSNRSIFSAMATSPFSIWGNPGDVRVAVKSNFTRGLGSLMNSLVSRVASTSGSSLVFETGDVLYSNLETIYGLVQCTPDISARDCIRCLQTSVSDLPICCDGKIAGGVHRPSCSLRYATFPLVELTGIAPAPSLISPAPTPMSTTIAGDMFF